MIAQVHRFDSLTSRVRHPILVATICGLLAVSCAHSPPAGQNAGDSTGTQKPSAYQVRAEQLLAAAEAAEVGTTKRLTGLAESVGGEMYKLKYRLKTKESLLRKMKKASADKTDAEIAAMEINDCLRYTMLVEDEPGGHHVETIVKVLTALRADGHTVHRLKNYWPKGDNYSGVNVALRSPDHEAGSTLWELQFHTKASSKAALQTREQYEQLRAVETPLEEKRKIFDAMAAVWEVVPIPEKMLVEQSLGAEEKIVKLDRP